MKRPLLALFCLGLSAILAAEPSPSKFGALAIGDVVPAFKMVNDTGAEMRLPGDGNTVVVLSIMGTNRSPGDLLESVWTGFHAQGVAVMAVCTGATREEFNAWRTKNQGAASYPLVWDPAGKNRSDGIAQNVFGVSAYPMTVVIDRGGKLVGGFVGFGAGAAAVLRGYLRTAGVPVPPEEEPKRPASPEDHMLKPGAVAPDFAAVDLAGQPVRLSEFAGKIVVLDFWATWCGPCIASMPHTQRVAAATKSQGVVVLAACTSDTRAHFESWLQQNGANYPDLHFANDPIGRDAPPEKYGERVSVKLYGVNGIPCQFVIGRDGRIADVIVGYGENDHRLEEALGRLGVKP